MEITHQSDFVCSQQVQQRLQKRGIPFVLGALVMCLVQQPAMAQKPIGSAVKVSTLGLGGELNLTLSDKVELMAGLNLYDYGYSTNKNQVAYKGRLNLNTLYTGVRFHPWANGLYVGGAAALNNNEINLNVQAANGKYRFNGNEYNADAVGSVKTKGVFYSLAPMLLLGWESKNVNKTGLSFFGEVGVLLGGAPRFEADVLCGQVGTTTCDAVKADFDVERQAIQKKLKNFYTYPILGVGVRYRF